MPEEKVMKGYKGFEKGLVCRNKQYAENTIFEEDKAEICKNGMHFCENPFDVWRYYLLRIMRIWRSKQLLSVPICKARVPSVRSRESQR